MSNSCVVLACRGDGVHAYYKIKLRTYERRAAAASPPDATTHDSRRVAAAHALRLPEPATEQRSFCGAVSGGRDGVRQRQKRRTPTHAGRVCRAQERPRGQKVAARVRNPHRACLEWRLLDGVGPPTSPSTVTIEEVDAADAIPKHCQQLDT